MRVSAQRLRLGRDKDVLLTVAALALSIITSLPGHGGAGHSALRIILAVLACLPLPARLRRPLPVAVAATALDAVRIAVTAHEHPTGGVIPAATMLALYTVALRYPPRTIWAFAGTAAVLQLVTSVLASGALNLDLLYLNWALVAAVLGRLMAERRDRIAAAEQRAADAEAGRAAEARRQVVAERLRIAHELHDVLAHHLAAVNAQAGVAEYLLRTDPVAAQTALAGIGDNTRAALEELRVTLGLLRTARDDDVERSDGDREPDLLEPAPGLDQLPALLERCRSSGLDLDTVISGSSRPLPPASELALFRIIQEALTNAGKHAPGSRITVTLNWTDDAVVATIDNTAPTRAAVARQGTGHGLIGMRERAAATGGRLRTEATAEGGYRVHLQLSTATGTDPYEGKSP